MAYLNPLTNARVKRAYKRTQRHGDWRQVWIDCGGI